MHFICTQENLLQGLAQVVPLAGRGRQLPVLQYVLCQAKDGVLQVTCTDLEVGARAVIAGKVETEGECVVMARSLLEYVQQLPAANPITFRQAAKGVEIVTKGFRASFPVASVEDFPLLPTITHERQVKVKSKLLCEALTGVVFAAARDDTRPEIHSVFVAGEGADIRCAATDSFRLAEEIITTETPGEPFSFLLPLTSAHEVIRLFADQEFITLFPHDSHIGFQSEGIELTSRLMQGTFPDYRQIIPKTYVVEGVVDRSSFARALKTLSVFLPRDSKRLTCRIAPEAEIMAMSVGGEIGEGVVDLPFRGQGEEITVLFNIQYLLDGVAHVPGSQCKLQSAGATEPALFAPLETDRRYVYVVMPIQL